MLIGKGGVYGNVIRTGLMLNADDLSGRRSGSSPGRRAGFCREQVKSLIEIRHYES